MTIRCNVYTEDGSTHAYKLDEAIFLLNLLHDKIDKKDFTERWNL
jgi:hypothetical protein